ncbi:DNA-directed RNA polymerase subunit alpha [Candidatus Daviesbacteria bacterium RIFCSPHIGHO2_02_FULL_41_14]|uniref:DNA-directed RNA polymerase subunit alpha n=1 Tax=Candidatus Daviesbacteria bacterium RIFCSPLOWO2_01_FULL_40_24 TaxID=1797787 RepID=A0A1F5MIY9_9BACT|nr:MAG: DNA-directed RNA polymerase subunit alpha [Candidatus Daviesbacteria bacterium RIFCSPHIGHO2_01_FULL_41_45]OGE34940.1 MAG: DNA-directed RNA polymerase subunit alpha [Candidatus Daviesbacteria bacterium RIFCSPHIGHO2_02_FULL_41_14]OGE65347.1 MAG: DNA-directed RNA polymerase subunit alpha [Candidatus Daviesbacteria bacterium RIFCSPLOWO2_01_FULL_40_24]
MLNFKTTLENIEENKGTFVLEPLERGFGHTVGNVLRRVLLSSLEGGAISSVKISGVSHVFSTIPGISEDVIEIILNLKKVRLSIYSDKQVKFSLKVSGKKDVKASDIDTLGTAEIINKDLHLASLNSPTAKLTIEMTAEKGVGYVMADDKKTNEIGVLPIDSIYSPVVEVSYKVEPTRVGRSSNFDKLTLYVTTDGTTPPEEALHLASRILSGYFKQIYNPTLDEEVAVEPVLANSALKLSVEELDLPVRITNALKAIEIDSVEKLTTVPKGTLLKAKNLGVQSVNLISQKLSERGLSLSEA